MRIDTNEYKCPQCGKAFKERDFYKSNSSINAQNGYMLVCKECLFGMFNFYNMQYRDSKLALKRICMMLDIYYKDDIFEKSLDDDGAFSLGKYMQRVGMVHYKGKTFDDSLIEGFTFGSSSRGINFGFGDDEDNESEEEIDPKLIAKWGFGLTSNDYAALESHYQFLRDANPKIDPNQEIFILELCYTYVKKMNAYREDKTDDYNKLSESYRKTFTQAGLKAVRETTSDEDFKLGVKIEDIEKYTPPEYYKNKKLFKDFDGLGEYFERFVLRPLRNLQHGTSDRDYEYYVKDEEDGVYEDEDE